MRCRFRIFLEIEFSQNRNFKFWQSISAFSSNFDPKFLFWRVYIRLFSRISLSTSKFCSPNCSSTLIWIGLTHIKRTFVFFLLMFHGNTRRDHPNQEDDESDDQPSNERNKIHGSTFVSNLSIVNGRWCWNLMINSKSFVTFVWWILFRSDRFSNAVIT